MPNFSASIGKFAVETIQRAENVGKNGAIKLFRGVILDTPVDTGRLRANWQATANSPALGELDLEDKTKEATPTIESMKSIVLAQGMDFTVFLSNNLPYAQVAEYGEWKDKDGNPANGAKTISGYAIQSPAGMVRRNMARIGTNLNKQMILIK